MVTIFIRTVIIYVLLVATMRLMGKRQLGELEVSELVTTLLISEIASLPIADQTIPVMHAVIPLITILTFEIVLSVILVRCPRLKNLVSTRPNVLIRHGKIDQAEMRRIRISIDELLSEIRQTGLSTPEDVDYAILEPNGKIAIIPKRSASAPTLADLNIKKEENGLLHALIEDGHLNNYNLSILGLTQEDITAHLQKEGLTPKDVFFLGADDNGNFYCVRKDKKR